MQKYRIDSFFKYTCLILLGAGIFFRFILLTYGYEYDEIFTAITANPDLSFAWIWKHWLLPDVHPPLHNLFLWIYNHWVPYGAEIWLRLPSVFFGIAGILLAWIAWPKYFGRIPRILFVSFLATHFYLIFYAQHARPYSLAFLLAVPLTFLFLSISRAIYKGRSIRKNQWAGWGILSLLLCWTHYFGALLFGVFSVFLICQAFYYKRFRLALLGITGGVVVFFLPWLLPNFLFNVSMDRFEGNWWANESNPFLLLPRLFSFFFSSAVGSAMWGTMTLLGGYAHYRRYKQTGKWLWGREQLLLAGVFLSVLGIAGLVSLKMFVMIARYFIVLLPVLFLLSALLLAVYVKKSLVGKILFILFLLQNMLVVFYQFDRIDFPARHFAQFHQKHAPEKEIFVIAVEAFPPAAMPAMYGYYTHQVLGLNVPVIELFQLDEIARNKALSRRENALLWLPNCEVKKLAKISHLWNRAVAVEGLLGSSCLLQIGEEGFAIPKEWEQVKEIKELYPSY